MSLTCFDSDAHSLMGFMVGELGKYNVGFVVVVIVVPFSFVEQLGLWVFFLSFFFSFSVKRFPCGSFCILL